MNTYEKPTLFQDADIMNRNLVSFFSVSLRYKLGRKNVRVERRENLGGSVQE